MSGTQELRTIAQNTNSIEMENLEPKLHLLSWKTQNPNSIYCDGEPRTQIPSIKMKNSEYLLRWKLRTLTPKNTEPIGKLHLLRWRTYAQPQTYLLSWRTQNPNSIEMETQIYLL